MSQLKYACYGIFSGTHYFILPNLPPSVSFNTNKPSLHPHPHPPIRKIGWNTLWFSVVFTETHRPHYNFKAGRQSVAPTIMWWVLPKDNNNNEEGPSTGGKINNKKRVWDIATNYGGGRKCFIAYMENNPTVGWMGEKKKLQKRPIFSALQQELI